MRGLGFKICVVLLLVLTISYAESKDNQSQLEKALSSNDTYRVNLLNQLSEENRRTDINQAIKNSQEAIISLSKKHDY